MMKIIVTGFEPFNGADKNESWETVKNLPGVQCILLPVSFSRAQTEIRKIVSQHPDAILCVGEASGRSQISFERVAVNLIDARIPDNDGKQPVDVSVRPEGPAAYFTTLPVRELMDAVKQAGIPAELSCSAGTYVCNTVFYALMNELEEKGLRIPAGFIHVPATAERKIHEKALMIVMERLRAAC